MTYLPIRVHLPQKDIYRVKTTVTTLKGLTREQITDIVFFGTFEDILGKVILPFLIPDMDVWMDIGCLRATVEDLGRRYPKIDADPKVAGGEIASTVVFIDSVVRSRFPAYDRFYPLKADGVMTQDETAAEMAFSLFQFFKSPNNILKAVRENSNRADN